jgi:hypothetical protein
MLHVILLTHTSPLGTHVMRWIGNRKTAWMPLSDKEKRKLVADRAQMAIDCGYDPTQRNGVAAAAGVPQLNDPPRAAPPAAASASAAPMPPQPTQSSLVAAPASTGSSAEDPLNVSTNRSDEYTYYAAAGDDDDDDGTWTAHGGKTKPLSPEYHSDDGPDQGGTPPLPSTSTALVVHDSRAAAAASAAADTHSDSDDSMVVADDPPITAGGKLIVRALARGLGSAARIAISPTPLIGRLSSGGSDDTPRLLSIEQQHEQVEEVVSDQVLEEDAVEEEEDDDEDDDDFGGTHETSTIASLIESRRSAADSFSVTSSSVASTSTNTPIVESSTTSIISYPSSRTSLSSHSSSLGSRSMAISTAPRLRWLRQTHLSSSPSDTPTQSYALPQPAAHFGIGDTAAALVTSSVTQDLFGDVSTVHKQAAAAAPILPSFPLMTPSTSASQSLLTYALPRSNTRADVPPDANQRIRQRINVVMAQASRLRESNSISSSRNERVYQPSDVIASHQHEELNYILRTLTIDIKHNQKIQLTRDNQQLCYDHIIRELTEVSPPLRGTTIAFYQVVPKVLQQFIHEITTQYEAASTITALNAGNTSIAASASASAASTRAAAAAAAASLL